LKEVDRGRRHSSVGGFSFVFALSRISEIRSQQGFRQIFHILQFITPEQKLRVETHEKTGSGAGPSIILNPLAPNPVSGLWSRCTQLHSKQIHFRVFR
jgi:hypothetical protein